MRRTLALALVLALAASAALPPPAGASESVPSGCAELVADFSTAVNGFYCSAGEVGTGPEADVVKSWTAPSLLNSLTFTLYGGDAPGSGRGGTVKPPSR